MPNVFCCFFFKEGGCRQLGRDWSVRNTESPPPLHLSPSSLFLSNLSKFWSPVVRPLSSRPLLLVSRPQMSMNNSDHVALQVFPLFLSSFFSSLLPPQICFLFISNDFYLTRRNIFMVFLNGWWRGFLRENQSGGLWGLSCSHASFLWFVIRLKKKKGVGRSESQSGRSVGDDEERRKLLRCCLTLWTVIPRLIKGRQWSHMYNLFKYKS